VLDSRPEIVFRVSSLDIVTFCCSVVALSLLLCLRELPRLVLWRRVVGTSSPPTDVEPGYLYHFCRKCGRGL